MIVNFSDRARPLRVGGGVGGLELAAVFTQCVLVEQIFSHAVLRCTHPAQVRHPVSQLLNGLHLLVQVVSLDEITHLEHISEVIRAKARTLVCRRSKHLYITLT